MRVDSAGWPFIGGAVAVALVAWYFFGALAGVPLLVLAGFFLFFFRDPERTAPAQASNVILAPADGKVIVAGDPLPGAAPPGEWRQISIFLSPMDVHVNRVPVSGVVRKVSFQRGKFMPAYRGEAGAENERSEVWVDHDGQSVVFRQIVGILARRVVCRLSSGQRVEAGDRCGIMKFGSRMDIFLPPTARLQVRAGDSVRAGETILATL